MPSPLFTVLVVVWVACGTAIAAWLLWDRHKQYEDHREEALGLWCKERALTLQQLVLAHAGQIQTLAGLISVMGTPGRPGKWDMGWCLNCNLWMSYLTRTAQTRPGNTGALACTVVRDAERAAFEREYGSIRDNTLIVSAHRPIYCAKVLELTTLWATNGPSNIDMFQRFSWAIPLVEAGRHFYTWPYPLANPLTHAGFGVVFPLFRNLPTNHSNQSAAGRAVYGSLAASVDVTYIAQKVLEELYAPDPSKSFELYDITDPTTLSAIVSPVPPHAYFRPDDKLPYMHPSPESETRPWEHRAVVPLEEMGGGVRKYEVWCSAWQQWGIPILIALFALLLVLLVLVAACLQRSKFYQTQQQVAEADRLRREAEGAEASKSMFVACMSHELRTPMVGIIGMIDAQADMGLNASQLADLLMAGASAKDALHLVNRVLDLAKLEAGKAVVDEAVIDVREWLSTTLGWHAEAAHSKGIELASLCPMYLASFSCQTSTLLRSHAVSAIVGDDCPTHVIVDPMHLSTMIKEITGGPADKSGDVR
ncbi:unnamed protein product [Closterium sp. NIES-65]|nr:unnamed protein product [Closterium sp. NIES-65]